MTFNFFVSITSLQIEDLTFAREQIVRSTATNPRINLGSSQVPFIVERVGVTCELRDAGAIISGAEFVSFRLINQYNGNITNSSNVQSVANINQFTDFMAINGNSQQIVNPIPCTFGWYIGDMYFKIPSLSVAIASPEIRMYVEITGHVQ